ncbi:mucin-17-like [Hyperolius riggenbachi]|uniref:mucin-17-like n=1 Tax=Hyperolius riggenbachi TaxID=752182 RepID=UPI0035A37851
MHNDTDNDIHKIWTLIQNTELVITLCNIKGSIRVDHDVYLRVDSKDIVVQYAKSVDTIYKVLSERNCTSDILLEGILCFNSSKATISRQDMDLSGLCSTVDTIPSDYRQYFYGVLNPNKEFMCVTNCSKTNQHFINCNTGQCLVNKNGPECYCETSDQFWYMGHQCQTAVSKAWAYGGLAGGLAIFAIIIVSLAVLLCRRRKYAKKNLADMEAVLNEWDFDDSSSSSATEGGFTAINHFLEIACENDAGSIVLPSSGSVSGSGSGSRTFHPSLENVNPYVMIDTPRPQLINHSIS